MALQVTALMHRDKAASKATGSPNLPAEIRRDL
jgi:hypothetical protein